MIEFDEATHTYKVDGVAKPSVTTILKDVGLFPDFYGTAEEREYYMQRGTMVHLAVQNMAEWILSCDQAVKVPDGKIRSTMMNYISKQDSRIEGYLWSFIKFLDSQWYPKVMASEKKVFSKAYNYCGTIDMSADVMLAGYFCEAVIDFKCGQPEPEYAYQLGAYALAEYPENYSAKVRLGVYLDKEGKLPKVKQYGEASDFQVFQSARYIYSKQRGKS